MDIDHLLPLEKKILNKVSMENKLSFSRYAFKTAKVHVTTAGSYLILSYEMCLLPIPCGIKRTGFINIKLRKYSQGSLVGPYLKT